jgi:hypothetical protein
MTWKIDTVEELDAGRLTALLSERTAAVRVPRFCPPEVAARIVKVLVSHPSRTNYQVRWSSRAGGDSSGHPPGYQATDVERVGPTDGTWNGAPEEADPLAVIRMLRAAAAPGLAPIDRLRLELDEIAPLGAGIQRDGGRLKLAGVGRVMERSDATVHADTGRRHCLTANVYLRVPARGGGTRIWRHDGDYRSSRLSYRFEPGEIPEAASSCLLEPECGDLVIWNPALPHVVLPFDDPPRVTLQTWLLMVPGEAPEEFGVRLLN